MSERIVRFGLFTALAAISTTPWAPIARADFFFHGWEDQRRAAGSFVLTPEIGLLSTTTNIDLSGNRVAPTSFNSYSRLQIDVTGAIGVSPRMTLWGRSTWANASLDTPTLANSNFGAGDQTVGTTIRLFETLPEKGFSIDLQGQIDVAPYSNPSAAAQSLPFLGDGSTDLTGGVFGNLPISENHSGIWWLTAGAAYSHRSDGFSAAVPWSATLHFKRWNQGLWAAAGLQALASLQTDPTAQGTRSTGAGGSNIVNAINPAHMSLKGRIGFQTSGGTNLIVSGWKTLAGNNVADLWMLQGGIQFQLGQESREKEYYRENPDQPQVNANSNQGFVTYRQEGKVIKVNDRLHLVKIDKGSQDGIQLGQFFDIFRTGKDGSIRDSIARARVIAVGNRVERTEGREIQEVLVGRNPNSEAVLKITEYFKDVWIEEGFVVKQPLQ
ncbi:MAG: hypothetical protein JNL01_07885 [Bdellovibrionales bacterium]|nr:hypothetical protein [Bdellovibrionales bacterium]